MAGPGASDIRAVFGVWTRRAGEAVMSADRSSGDRPKLADADRAAPAAARRPVRRIALALGLVLGLVVLVVGWPSSRSWPGAGGRGPLGALLDRIGLTASEPVPLGAGSAQAGPPTVSVQSPAGNI